MTLPVGKSTYTHGSPPVVGNGVSWTQDDLDLGSGEIAAAVFDEAGKKDITAMLSGVVGTDFDSSKLKEILDSEDKPEPWRVGEAIAEVYLTQHRGCSFPWPDGRDVRKAKSSLPGADLVGFQREGGETRFAFGEVKTSSEAKHPPGAMYGETGLKHQIEDLRDSKPIRHQLFQYLAHRASNASWKDSFAAAASRYLKDNADVRVFGCLVRDVAPHEDDVRVRVGSLAKGCPKAMAIELLGLYLPEGSIPTLGDMVSSGKGGGA